MRIFIFVLFILISPAHAALDIDISEPNLEITTGFTGDTLTLFGTAKPRGDIVILVKGPRKDIAVRRKANVMGLWLHGRSMTFRDVWGYYNIASSKPIADIASPDIQAQYNMGLNSLAFIPKDKEKQNDISRFTEALIQNKQLSGLYALTPNAVDFLNDSLFKTTIHMPANVPLGDYEIEAFLLRNGQLIDQETHPFNIAQVGIAANVHDFAYDRPFLYGVSVILLALLSSLIAIVLLRRE
jgi:uncharacterized protein (TIGR02186 family)